MASETAVNQGLIVGAVVAMQLVTQDPLAILNGIVRTGYV
jgi:hypothetical protein